MVIPILYSRTASACCSSNQDIDLRRKRRKNRNNVIRILLATSCMGICLHFYPKARVSRHWMTRIFNRSERKKNKEKKATIFLNNFQTNQS